MSIATVVTRGYGTFGSVNKLPTLGYGSAAPVALVRGPILFHAGEIYRPGGQQGKAYRPGVQSADIYRPGAMAGEAE